jgi:cysteine-rich repeat protein
MRSSVVWLSLLAVTIATTSRANADCVGDCNGDGIVALSETVEMVGIALGVDAPGDCPAADPDGDGSVSIAEMLSAVTESMRADGGCCGDGVAQASEECDDGNAFAGDGCSGVCRLEPGGDVCAGVASRSGTALVAELVVGGLSQPLYVATPPLDPNRLFIVEQGGRIRVFENGVLLAAPFLDLSGRVSCCGERGLLGLAFHPDYEENGRFFIDYTNRAGDTVIARYRRGDDATRADPESEQILLTIDQPFANHNGGQLAFGPDGFLYVGMGDGGSRNDPFDNAQNDEVPLGKLLRLDVEMEAPPFYRVPASNPHPERGDVLGLVWANGLRNPWRFSFDRATGDLYIGDVGQANVEEVDVQPASSSGGENYGWDVFEGSTCFEPAPLPECPVPPDGYVFPVVEYRHNEGCSVTGGYVYRGCAMPDLRGAYFYGDYCSAFVRSFVLRDGAATDEHDWTQELRSPGTPAITDISSFGEDARGEVYVVDIRGLVFKLVPKNVSP